MMSAQSGDALLVNVRAGQGRPALACASVALRALGANPPGCAASIRGSHQTGAMSLYRKTRNRLQETQEPRTPAIRTRTGSANSPPNRQYDERMRARAAVMVSLLGIVALAGCTPDPGPAPTPSSDLVVGSQLRAGIRARVLGRRARHHAQRRTRGGDSEPRAGERERRPLLIEPVIQSSPKPVLDAYGPKAR